MPASVLCPRVLVGACGRTRLFFFVADFVSFVLAEFAFRDFFLGEFAFGRFFFAGFFRFVFKRFFESERSRFGCARVAMRDGCRQQEGGEEQQGDEQREPAGHGASIGVRRRAL